MNNKNGMISLIVSVVLLVIVFCVMTYKYRKLNDLEILSSLSGEGVTECELQSCSTNTTTTKIQQTTELIATTSHTEQTTFCQEDCVYFSNDIDDIAKVLYLECGASKSKTEQACVVWVIFNRVDAGYGDIESVIKSPGQFAYNPHAPVVEDLRNLAIDVYIRWGNEKSGDANIGRVLPSDYLWFDGDNLHNYFYNTYPSNGQRWDYSLKSPYSS